MCRQLLLLFLFWCATIAALAQPAVPHSTRLPPTRRYAVFHALSIPYLDFSDISGKPHDTLRAPKQVHKAYQMEKVFDRRGNLTQFLIRDPDDPRMELKAKFTYRGDSITLASVAHVEASTVPPTDRYLLFRVREDVDSTVILPTIFRGATFKQVVIRYYPDGTMRAMEITTARGSVKMRFNYRQRDPQYTEILVTAQAFDTGGKLLPVIPADPVIREVVEYNRSYTLRTRLLQR